MGFDSFGFREFGLSLPAAPAGGVAPEWRPEEATTHIDAALGHYYTNGAEVSAAAVFGDPSKIVPDTGYVLETTDTVVAIIGNAAADLIQTSGTIVFGYKLEESSGGVVIVANNDDDSNERWLLGPSFAARYDDDAYAEADADANDLVFDPALNLLAMNYDPAGSIVVSLNGNAFVEDATPVVAAVATQVLLGGYSLGASVNPRAFTLVSITRYDLRPNTALPTLSGGG